MMSKMRATAFLFGITLGIALGEYGVNRNLNSSQMLLCFAIGSVIGGIAFTLATFFDNYKGDE